MRGFIFILSLLLPLVIPVVSPTRILTEISTLSAQKADTELKTAEQVVDEVCTFLKAQRSFTFDMDVSYDDVLDSGAKVQYSAYQRVWVQKPDRLRSDYTGDERVTRFYYDGKSFTLEDLVNNLYVTKAAPSTLDEALDRIEEQYGITIPMSNLVADDPCANLKADIQKIIFVGTDMVNREPMYHILLIGSDRDFQIWVTRDSQPLLTKAIITYKTLPGLPQYTVLLSNWNFNPQISADTFTFTPAPDSVEIEILPGTDNGNVPQQ